MSFDLSALNAKYRNLSEISYSENAWRIVRVNDYESEKAYRSLLNCWSEKFLGDERFAELRGVLRDAYVGIRSAVGRAANLRQHFLQVLDELQTAIHNADNFLSPHERGLLEAACVDVLAYSKKIEYPLTIATVREGQDPRRKVAVVVNGHGFVDVAEGLSENLEVFPSITRALASLNYRDRNHVIVVGAPDQNLPINQIRLLMVGGYAVKVTFIVPTWWSTGAARHFSSQLWFGLDGKEASELKEVGDLQTVSSETEATFNVNWDVSVPASPISKRVENYVNSGPIECNLFILNQDLVMPIETGASRVAVIRQSKNDHSFELDYTTPKRAAERHDVVFSFAQVSERSFIKEQADKYLGDDLQEIQDTQNQWRKRLIEKGMQLGWTNLAKELADSGVEKAHRVRWWAQDPNFIRPQLEADFQKLLAYLGFQAGFISEAFAASRMVNHARDTAGTIARGALGAAMSQQIWENLQNGTPSEISLDDVGEASFVASKIDFLKSDLIFSGVLQVRRILGGQKFQ